MPIIGVEVEETKHQTREIETRLRIPKIQADFEKECMHRRGVSVSWTTSAEEQTTPFQVVEHTFWGDYPNDLLERIVKKYPGADAFVQHLVIKCEMQSRAYHVTGDPPMLLLFWYWDNTKYSIEDKMQRREQHVKYLQKRLVSTSYKQAFIEDAVFVDVDASWVEDDVGGWQGFVNPRYESKGGYQHFNAALAHPDNLITDNMKTHASYYGQTRLVLWLWTSPELKNNRDQLIYWKWS